MHEWSLEGAEGETVWRDGVRAPLAADIRKERRGRADAASENSRKDNKGEGVSCERPLRKSPRPSTAAALLRAAF